MVVDGIIIIVEDSEAVTEDNNCSVACNKMFAHMQVEAIPNNDCFSTSLNSAGDVFCLDLQMDSSLKELCDALGQRLDYDPKKIVLWRSTSPTERPGSIISQEDFNRCTMHGNFNNIPDYLNVNYFRLDLHWRQLYARSSELPSLSYLLF